MPMKILESAISICLFFSGCTYYESDLVRDMDNSYNAVKVTENNHEEIKKIRNENVTAVVVKSLGSMSEDALVAHLINSEFRVIRYEDKGLRIINDGTFKLYSDESFKKSALSNLQGSYRYLASKDYKECIFCNYEARVIFDVDKNSVVNLRGYVYFHSI